MNLKRFENKLSVIFLEGFEGRNKVCAKFD